MVATRATLPHHHTSRWKASPEAPPWRLPMRRNSGNRMCNRADMHVTDTTLDQPTPTTTTPRMRVLINPHSGAKGGLPTNRAATDDVPAALEAAGIVADVVVTE